MPCVETSQDITLVVLQQVPADVCLIASIFTLLAKAEINVDMISQTPPKGSLTTLSFTIADEQLSNTVGIIGRLREAYRGIRPLFSSGHAKVTIQDSAMNQHSGVAAGLFTALARFQVEPRLITTSESEISLLVEGSAEYDTTLAAKHAMGL